jgi:uncharacterized protein
MAKDMNCSINDLISNKELRQQIDLSHYVNANIGMPTLTDIMHELDKPGLDPREKLQDFSFDKNVVSFDDLRIGMVLPGIISNITNFGCFVDIGIKQKGLIHISQLSNSFVKDPNEIVHLHQNVLVKVIDLDQARNRIALSLLLD